MSLYSITSHKVEKLVMLENHDIEKPARHDEAADDFSQGKQVAQDFWESPTIDELAESQNVQPMVDGQTLFGTWPGEVDDEFEAIIDDLRHPR